MERERDAFGTMVFGASNTVSMPFLLKMVTGELEIRDEEFPDDDEVAYGNVDPYTDWRREEFPDGFEWTCCEGNANAEGCKKTRHDCDNSTDDESPSEEEESDESDNEGSIP